MPPAVPALEAADKLLLAREVVCTVVSSHGLAVTWLPKPMAAHAGSGCHVHFSLRRVSRELAGLAIESRS